MDSTELTLVEEPREGTIGLQGVVPQESSGLGTYTRKLFTFTSICFCMLSYVSLVNLNKVVMDESIFPHSAALTWCNQLCTLILGLSLYAIFGSALFPKLGYVKAECRVLVTKIVPLSLFFAAYITCSVEANAHCTVAFIQMSKQLNPALVYSVMLCCGLERHDNTVVLILMVIIFGSSLAIHGELAFSATGCIVQLSAQACKTLFMVIEQTLMQRGLQLDALSAVLVISPFALVFLSGWNVGVWEPEILERGRKHWMLILLHSLTAFCVDVAVTMLVKYASALTYMVVNAFNSIVVVVVASMIFGNTMTPRQALGYGISIVGILYYSYHRSTKN